MEENNNKFGQEPAFGVQPIIENGQYMNMGSTGLSKREYAAIKLKVPDSGEPWLDDMIRKANRRDIACAAIRGILSTERYMIVDNDDHSFLVEKSNKIADEFIKQQNQ